MARYVEIYVRCSKKRKQNKDGVSRNQSSTGPLPLRKDTTSDASLDARTTSAVGKLTQVIDESATMLVSACVPPEGVLLADRGMPGAGVRQESRLQAGVLSALAKDTQL